jgi:YHS domain-containing protein
MEDHKCQLPSLNKETGEIIPCHNTDIKVFNYQGNDFYFCSEHYDLFSKNIDNLYQALKEEVEKILV